MEDDIVVRLYRLLLNLYPAAYRQQLGEEMVSVFTDSADDARRQGGPALARLILRELVHFPGSLLLAYGQSWQQLRPAVVNAPGWPWIAGWTLLSSAMLPLAWFLMPLLSVIYLSLLDLLPGVGPASDLGTLLGTVTALGLATAFGQWLLLRRHLSGAGWWMPLTIIGWLTAGLLIFALVPLVDARLLGPGVVLVVVGGCVGLAQWLLLRRLPSGGRWWLPVTLLATGAILAAGQSFESIMEGLAFLALPFFVTGAFLWLLLQRAPEPAAAVGLNVEDPHAQRVPSVRPGRVRLLVLAMLVLIPLLFAGPWSYAVARLEMAKREGVYASPEEAVRTRAAAVEGVEVENLQMTYSGPNDHDGELPHVWFAGASVTYNRPHPYTGRRYVSMGSFYLRVEEGWVHVPEGAFPTLIGRLMEIYHLEGVGSSPAPTASGN